ncbi:MAG: 2-deoxy-5-keto-D-gluconate 6-phosphate aldolase domain-containing protein, partial [Burkholderiaceae bacterium]
YVKDVFGLKTPLTREQHEAVSDSKRVIYEGFKQAVESGVNAADAGILVDEEFGADILRDASERGTVIALSTEKSGSDEFEFEYGDAFAEHIEKFKPTFAKVLVRYNPEGDAALNERQTERLKQLYDYCRGAEQRLLFELLVPATKAQLARVESDKHRYDRRIRPELMLRSMRALQDGGVEPDVWKIEGLSERADCERIVEAAQRDGRSAVRCIVLGRGADQKEVVKWLETAAAVPGFTGFAVGRTTFGDAITDYVAKKATRQQAAARIAEKFSNWVAIFEKARASQAQIA